MRNVSFFSKAICLFLFTMILTNCSSTDIGEEVGIENSEIIKKVDEEEIQTKSIDKEEIKVPTQG